MRAVAILSDIHGNLPALEAVLNDVRAAQPDVIVLNGDLVDGPFPAQTFDLLDRLGGLAVWLRGNGDRWLAEAARGDFRHDDGETRDLIAWSAGQLSVDQLNRLEALPLTHQLSRADFGEIGICHATARDDNEMFLVDSSFGHAADAFRDLASGTVIVGHSHMPFDRLFDRRRIVNTGSVGMPYGHAGAAWALVGTDIVLKRTPYNVGDACARIVASGMPGAAHFADAYVRQTPSDRDAMAVFSDIRARQVTLSPARPPAPARPPLRP